MSEQKRRPFVLGRRCPDDNFKQSVARQLRMLELVEDAEYVDALSIDHPGLYALFGINDALQDQERGAPFIPGEHKRGFLERLTESEHETPDALAGLVAVGVADMAEAHRRQLRDMKRERRPERSSRRLRRIGPTDQAAA